MKDLTKEHGKPVRLTWELLDLVHKHIGDNQSYDEFFRVILGLKKKPNCKSHSDDYIPHEIWVLQNINPLQVEFAGFSTKGQAESVAMEIAAINKRALSEVETPKCYIEVLK